MNLIRRPVTAVIALICIYRADSPYCTPPNRDKRDNTSIVLIVIGKLVGICFIQLHPPSGFCKSPNSSNASFCNCSVRETSNKLLSDRIRSVSFCASKAQGVSDISTDFKDFSFQIF